MATDDAGDVTLLLRRMADGDTAVEAQLLSLIYLELRGLADSHLRGQPKDSTLQPTALVHEAYLRLAGREGDSYANRRQFFAMASRAMRSVLVDAARRRVVRRRDDAKREVAAALHDAATADPEDLIDLDAALTRLEAIDPRRARIVDLLFFAALPLAEVADLLECAPRTIERQWAAAKAWLYREMR
jgi:RNA polymerase sigma factor (TIGR02999 family)